jgi:glyoxylase-like metal-dependent hydrolase (beta-lactamase superfamily II)
MTPTRRSFLRHTTLALTAALTLPRFARADDAPPAAAPNPFGGKLEITRLENDVHVLFGAGGNIIVCGDADHLLVIDSGIPQRGAEVLAQAQKLVPDARRKTLVDTHWHFDHAGGNDAFAAAAFSIVASTATRTRLGQRITFEDMGMTVEPSPQSAWPTTTFDDRLTLHAGDAGPVTLTKFKPAHTDTDIVAVFDKHGILHTGDLLFARAFPVIDRSTGGSLDGYIAATQKLLEMVDDKTRVVPGHGPMSTKAELTAQHDLLRLTRERLAPLAEKNLPMQEVLDKKPFADLDDKWGRGFVRSPLYTRMTYGQWVK